MIILFSISPFRSGNICFIYLGAPVLGASAIISLNKLSRDFPGVPVVKNPPSNAGDVGSIPGQGTK